MSGYVEGSVWYYAPSKGAPIAFASLFIIIGLIHLYQTIHYRSWRYTVLLPWAATEFAIGYIIRAIAAWNYGSVALLIVASVLSLLAAPIYAAVSYFILGRTLYYIPYLSPIHPGRVVSTFIGLDTVIGILIGTGAWRVSQTKNPGSARVGRVLVQTAMILQIIMFVGFIAIEAVFHRRCLRANVMNKKLRTVLLVQYASSGLILTRSLFRTVEFFLGPKNSIVRNEWYFWVFESSLMLINALILAIWFPGKYLPRSNKIYLSKDGIEVEGTGFKDNRPFVVTLFDPFDVWGLITGKDKQNRFWEEENQLVERDTGDQVEDTRRRVEESGALIAKK